LTVRRSRRLRALAVVAVALGCRDASGPGAPDRLEAAAGVAELVVGDTTTVRLTADGAPLTDAAGARWRSSDTTVAVVDSTGLVTTRGIGTATIGATVRGAAASVVVTATHLRLADIATNGSTGCGVATTGRLYCWGWNGNGELGLGVRDEARRPIPEAVHTGARFARLLGGGSFCGFTVEQTVVCWAAGSQSPGVPDSPRRWRDVRPTLDYACGVATDARAYCWGQNRYGSLGNGVTAMTGSATPQPVAGDLEASAVATSPIVGCLLTPAGKAWCWGTGQVGTTRPPPDVCEGRGSRGAVVPVPCFTRPVPVDGDVAFVSLIGHVSGICGLTADARAYCWGEQVWIRQLGVEQYDFPDAPVPTASFGALRVRGLSTSSRQGCVLAVDGTATCWGTNRLGHPASGREPADLPQATAWPLRFRTISVGDEAICGVTTDGEGMCWGDNHRGQLGTDAPPDCYPGKFYAPYECSPTPVRVDDPRPLLRPR
jgi:hypothetical protein